MNFSIEPSDFTLLSEERQNAFTPSGNKFKKSLDKAIKEVCSHVRNILPWVQLSRLAHQYQIETWILVVLSNYATSAKKLEWALKNNRFLSHIWYLEWLTDVKDIIENDFKNFWLQNIWEIEDKLIARQQKRQEQSRRESEIKAKERVEVNNDQYKILCEYFNLPDNTESRITLRNHWIRYSTMAQDIITYCSKNNITSLWKDWWSEDTRPNFLYWYAETHNVPLSHSPDDRASYAWIEHLTLYL